MMTSSVSTLQRLLDKGVMMPNPASVTVGEEVCAERIHETAVLHPGTRLEGAQLSLGPECEIGAETPATVRNCQLGRGVSLKGGFFEGSVFLDDSSVGSSAHVRPGCLLEEQACAAHAVGLKQTILFPFVTLGSLINFCDVLMAGGTSRKNHSEVGSSFIHFNFTPHSDKATASLIGDAAQGVLLNQKPIFLGGQGGIVGPVEVAYGVVQAAGSICRQDLMEPDHLFQSAVTIERWAPYEVGQIRDAAEKWRKNLKFIASLNGLGSWYRRIRRVLMADDVYTQACLDGAEALLTAALAERLKQLRKWTGFLSESPWEGLLAQLNAALAQPADETLLEELASGLQPGSGYIEGVRAFTPDQQQMVQHFFESEIKRLSFSPEGL